MAMTNSNSEADGTDGNGSNSTGTSPATSKRMYGFVRLPSDWIRQGRLKEFTLAKGQTALKTYLALAVMQGRFGRRPIGRGLEFFPANVTDLAEIAGLHRQAVVQGLHDLRDLKLIERLSVNPAAL